MLLPATAASAEDMPAMQNGMLCPHAMGDPSNPATAVPPARTSTNEAPLGAKPASVTQSSPARPATKPASKAPAEQAAARTPASAPATTTAKSQAGVGATAPAVQTQRVVVAQPQHAVTPAAQPQRVVTPVAQPRHASPRPHRAAPKHTPAVRRVSTPAVTPTVIPEVTRPSAGSVPQATSTATGSAPAEVAWLAIGGALMLAGCAAAIVARRRRGSSGAAVIEATPGPLEPSLLRREQVEVDEVEVALREMLAEARAWELLGNGEHGEAADREVSVTSR
ncbi:MAG TPA: hypothetical protein VGC59_09230 [Solirubrobacteraceae bacterium]